LSGEGPLRYRHLWLAIGYGLVGLVIYMSLTPSPIDAGKVEEIKVGHFIAYFVLMLWFAQIYQSWPTRLGMAAAFVLMGVGLEYAQGLTSYRSFAHADMVDNAIGVAVGLAMGSTPAGRALARIERWTGKA
jgi:VanZ family protein